MNRQRNDRRSMYNEMESRRYNHHRRGSQRYDDQGRSGFYSREDYPNESRRYRDNDYDERQDSRWMDDSSDRRYFSDQQDNDEYGYSRPRHRGYREWQPDDGMDDYPTQRRMQNYDGNDDEWLDSYDSNRSYSNYDRRGNDSRNRNENNRYARRGFGASRYEDYPRRGRRYNSYDDERGFY
ncbi:MAG: hypothetical protein ACK4E0_14640 [Chitinophagaceae bacterium]